jgi:formate-dependent nitrite reductase membrane component NrfD
MWSEQGSGAGVVTSGHPGSWNSSAAAVLSYDIPHRAPWDWRVSLYTWTKGIAAGVYVVALGLALAGGLAWTGALWRFGVPVIAGIFLAATGGLLLWDLDHPERFRLIFTRPQWQSWLVRGGFIIGAYGVVLLLHFLMSVIGLSAPQRWLAILGSPLAVATAVYTAYLFAQAKARDLWQNPLAPFHLLVQAVLAGAAALALLAMMTAGAGLPAWLNVVAAASLLHLALIASEHTLAHATAHAKLAAREMTRGRYAPFFWGGAILVYAGVFAPWLGPLDALAALAGLLAHEHAYVQSGQAVPLA